MKIPSANYPFATSVFSVVALLACSPHKVTHNPAPPITVNSTYQHIAEAGGNLPDRWWQDFGDGQLNSLVENALAGNLQIKAARQRVLQAQAVADQMGARHFPTLDAVASSGKYEPTNPFTPSSTLALQASYEVDIFKGIGNQKAVAGRNTMSAQDQVEGIAMTLVAQIAETWFGIVAQNARLALLDEQIKVSQNFLALAKMRLGQGLGSALDVLQQRQQLAAVQGQRPLIAQRADLLRNQLAVLTGQPPGSITASVASILPSLPPRPAAGVPADLLLRRPDVRAARLQVESADYGVAVAVANRLPKLSLSGQYAPIHRAGGVTQTDAIWNVVANLFAPIFHGGQLKAEVTRNEAVVKERSYHFGQTLLQAILEVENALVQEKRQAEYVDELNAQHDIAKRTLDEARRRYRDGIGNQSFVQILAALSTSQQIEQTLLSAQQQALSYRIQLCRSLGGTWTKELFGDTSNKGSDDE